MRIEALTESRAWLAAGWTMLHFFWVGGVIGLIAALGRRALRGAAPETRYAHALLSLSAMAVAPAAIALLLPAVDDGRLAPTVPRAADNTPLPFPSAVRSAPERPDAPHEPATAPLRWALDRPTAGSTLDRCLETAAAWLPWLWIVGAPSTFALMVAGLVGAERLRRRSRPLPDGELTALARRLASTIGIVRPVALGVCDRLAAPILLGVVRPTILLPAAAVTGWSPDQLEMALLHELAHVRRLDNLVNLAQRVVESLLFFHPAVWWVSGWVRLEREHCCDRLVVARTGRARPYAAMLAELAMHRNRPGRATVAMAESPIVARIRCILNPEDHLMPLSRPVVALAVVLLAAPAILIASQAGAPGPGVGQTTQPQAAGALGKADRARIDELLRRTRHGADMFLGVQDRTYALIQIARVQARTGDREAARRTFRQAEQLAETVSFDDATYSPHILLWIVQAEARHGFRDDAIAAARKLLRLAEAPSRREIRKADLYNNLIETQMKLGDRAGAQETLRAGRTFFETSKEPVFMAYAPVFIVGLQAASGDLAGALRMVRDPAMFKGQSPENAANLRHDALFNAVRAINANNREGAGPVLEEALRVVAVNNDLLPWRGMVMNNQDLQTIAYAQARLGQFDAALKSARMIDAESIPGRLAGERKSGFLDEQRSRKAQTLAELSLEQVKAGDRAGARRTAEEAARIAAAVGSESDRYTPTWRTAEALVKAGDSAGALRLADTLIPDHRVEVYESIAATRRDIGDADGARTILQAALALARRRLEDFDAANRGREPSIGPERNRLLASLGRLQAKLGDCKQAFETTRQINDGTQQLEALKGIATDLASAGDLDGALDAAGRMNSPKAEAEALEAVASAFSRREPAPLAR